MELNVHFFNVSHGDSIVVEIRSTTDKYIVIDSNLLETESGYVNPAYEFLREKNVRHLNALIITHFHRDHYAGVESFLNNLTIESVFIPPVLTQKSMSFDAVISRYRDSIAEITRRTSDPLVLAPMKSLAHLLLFLSKKQNEDKVLELCGRESVLRIPGISEAELRGTVYLPLPKIKGILHKKLEDPNFQLEPFPEANDASIAFVIEFLGSRVLLTGDSTLSQWREHRRQMKKTLDNLDAMFLKVPHHGSRENNIDDVYLYFFRDPNGKNIFISANGRSHPHKEIFDLVSRHSLLPHCTNLADSCIASNVTAFPGLWNVPDEMRQFLLHYSEPTPIPCQGNIKLTIDDKRYLIENSTGLPCVYRA